MTDGRQKRLLIINWRDRKNPEAGGAEIYYHEIFKRLAARGFDVSVLAHAWKGCPATEEHDGIHVIRHGSRSLFNYAVIPWLLKHQDEYDLIIEDLNKIPFFTPLYVKRPRFHLVMHFFGTSIFHEINPVMASYILFMEKLVPIIYRKEKFLAISNSTRQEIARFCANPGHVHVVEPGIESSFFRASKPKSATPLLVCLSRLKKYKNVQFLIPAFAQIKKQIPDAEMDIAGSGDYLGELKILAAGLGLEKSIRFPGFITEAEKRNLMSRATLFVNPSIKEGWGITNIEAGLCGTISLSSNVPGLRDSVKDGETGLLFEYGNQADFVAKAIEILKDDARRRQLEKNALAYAKTFDWDAVAGRMEAVIKQYV